MAVPLWEMQAGGCLPAPVCCSCLPATQANPPPCTAVPPSPLPRYLCPIGGMNGLFAKLAMVELRASQGVCSSTCSTYHCYKGGPEEAPEGLETNGCPVYSHPAQASALGA